MLRVAGHSCRDRHGLERLAAMPYTQPLDRSPQLFGAPPGILQRRVRQNKRKLLTAVAASDILGAGVSQQQPAERPQQSIAGSMAKRIVDRLEMIDVEHNDAQRATAPRRPAQLAVERLLHVAPVEQIRQRSEEHTSELQ